jgi:hypothetical protein
MVDNMSIFGMIHKWWRDRVVGTPSSVIRLGDMAADDTIRRTRAEVLVLKKTVETYRLAAKKVSAGGDNDSDN